MNQTCQKLSLFIDNTHCASNNVDLECSGLGDCSNTNICHCEEGHTGEDCSDRMPDTTTTSPSPTTHSPTGNHTTTQKSVNERITNRGPSRDTSHTVVLVFGMLSVVGGVFILFAMMALCYRRSTGPKYPEGTKFPNSGGTPAPKGFNIPQPIQTAGMGGPMPPSVPPRTTTDMNHTEELEHHHRLNNRMLSLSQIPTYR